MKSKTYFDRLPKRDRDEVVRLEGLLAHKFVSLNELVAERLRVLAKQRDMPGNRPLKSCLAGMFQNLRADFTDHGILRRLLDDDVSALAPGIDASSRMGLLMRVAGGTEYPGGYDCLQVFDLLSALAVADWPLVQTFLDRFPGPFRLGHPTTVLLANGVNAVIRDDRAAFAAIEQRLRDKRGSHFDRAVFDCLLAIMANDASGVSDKIDEMLKGNRRQEWTSYLLKLICIQAHALYNLCLRVFQARGTVAPPIPSGPTWDVAFHTSVHASHMEPRQRFFDFAPVSPVFMRWMQELPATLNIDDVLADVQ